MKKIRPWKDDWCLGLGVYSGGGGWARGVGVEQCGWGSGCGGVMWFGRRGRGAMWFGRSGCGAM